MEELIGYYRVSTDRQGRSGLGLDAQRHDVHRYAEQMGGKLVAEFVEIESGRRNSRPILAEAMTACKKQRAKLVIAKLDRLARNVAFVTSILDSKVPFVACDAPHADRMFLQMLSVFAEHEARMISQRTKAALAAAKARGVVLGSYGAQLAANNRAAADAFAEQMRGAVVNLINDSGPRLQDIADAMNRAGLVTREGCKWGPVAVHRILRRLDLRIGAIARTTPSSLLQSAGT